MKQQLRQGVFGAGWPAALVCFGLGVALCCTFAAYAGLNHGPNRIFTKTALDDLIPLVKPFVIPYVSLYPFIGASLVLFLLFRTRLYQSAVLAMIAACLVSYGFYGFLQSYMDRPPVSGDDGLAWMIRRVYEGDNPFNCFPSLHASLSATLAIHWRRADKRIALPVAVWVSLIVLSTVFVKQHYVPDVVAGLALAAGAAGTALRCVFGRSGSS